MLSDITDVVQAGLRQERKLDIIANHLANINTPGFKADILSFDEMLRAEMTTDHSDGGLMLTDNVLDFAIGGEGFFKIQTPQGIRYTRNGTFTLNSDNTLVTLNGDTVLSEGGPIVINGNDVDVGESGEIWVQDPTTKDFEMAGKLDIVTFASKEKLIKEGNSLFAYSGPETDETTPDTVQVRQGQLEKANVSTVIEMTKMIETMRHFESCMKTLQALDEADGRAITELGKV